MTNQSVPMYIFFSSGISSAIRQPSWDLLVVVTYIHSTGFLFAERKHQAAPQMKTFTKGILSIHYAMLLGLVNGKIILHCSLHFLMMVRANNT